MSLGNLNKMKCPPPVSWKWNPDRRMQTNWCSIYPWKTVQELYRLKVAQKGRKYCLSILQDFTSYLVKGENFIPCNADVACHVLGKETGKETETEFRGWVLCWKSILWRGRDFPVFMLSMKNFHRWVGFIFYCRAFRKYASICALFFSLFSQMNF